MQRFLRSTILPLLRRYGHRRICEIGSGLGRSTDLLLTLPGLEIEVVDPCVDCDLERKYEHQPRVRVHRGRSLDLLPALRTSFDSFLIDGDHNWFTVFHELQTIEKKRMLTGPGIIFLHDVCWPYARRDQYYDPDAVPPEQRHPLKKGGVVRGESELSPTGWNAHLHHATHEGGPGNGVLTAIEDFLKSAGRPFSFLRLEKEFGLGLVYPRVGSRGVRLPATLRLRAARYRLRAVRSRAGSRLGAWLPAARSPDR